MNNFKNQLPYTYEIPANSKCHIPRRWVFIDTETWQDELTAEHTVNRLQLGWALYWERPHSGHKEKMEWHHFGCIGDFWDWLAAHEADRETIHLVAHNVPFDFMVLAGFRELPERGYKLAGIYHSQAATILQWRKGRRGVRVLDSMNWWPVALRELGEMVHLPKGNYNEASLDDTLLSEYCKRDTEIVYRAVRGLIAELEGEDLGSLRYTAASVAWSVYRHKFYPVPVITHHKPVPVLLERHAYVGGMVKICKLYAPPKKEIIRYDVNSMYPYVMRENGYPAKLVELLPGLDVDHLAAYLNSACVIADVDVDTDEPIYPFRSAKRVWYPVGKFRSMLCTGSLSHALRAGHLRKVRIAAVYERRDLFSEYVDHFYARKVKAKKAHDTAGERFAKLCLNSLYGKFGQKGTEVTEIGDAPIDVFRSEETWDTSTGEQWRMLEAGGRRLRIERGGETLSSFPAVAAHVTDYARLYLWSLMQLAGLDNVYYTDTDSLMVNGRGALRLTPRVSAYELGYLKTQGESWGVKIFAKKDYLFDMDRKCKAAKAPESIRPDGTYTEIHGLGIYAAAEIEAIEGAHWRRVTKYYNPYVDGCKVDPWYNVHPLRLPRDLGRLTKKTYTWPMIGGKK